MNENLMTLTFHLEGQGNILFAMAEYVDAQFQNIFLKSSSLHDTMIEVGKLYDLGKVKVTFYPQVSIKVCAGQHLQPLINSLRDIIS